MTNEEVTLQEQVFELISLEAKKATELLKPLQEQLRLAEGRRDLASVDQLLERISLIHREFAQMREAMLYPLVELAKLKPATIIVPAEMISHGSGLAAARCIPDDPAAP